MNTPTQLGFDLGGGSERHSLFLALWPDEALRTAIANRAAAIKASHGVKGDWIKPQKYHATVLFLGEYSELRADLVEGAKRAVSQVTLSRFDWTLDVVDSFRSKRPPCILRSRREPAALLDLWQQPA